MGQQQTVSVAGSAVRRINLALLVATLMAVMMVAMAAPAMASSPCGGQGWHTDQFGQCQFKNFRD
jgi:hypothetical protein